MERTVKANQSMSYTLLCAVAEVEGCRPTDLPPLHDTLDVDALEALFSSETDERSRFEGSFMFEYSDSFVSIWSDRVLTVSIASRHDDRIKPSCHGAQ
ncbi:HalOD1 output domain-containing protein [Halorubrum sp. DTA98]|uniref:HalOD1 output domain-containing protein n=1 Tax=Halorubrum sp. DTA98 TaxID=3402163 RepID=UPI003AAE6D02